MRPAPTPRWQQATALVSLSAGGVVTGLSFVPGSPADVTSPAALPFALMALEKSANSAPSDDAALRSAIVNVARHFLHMAQRKSPSEMEAIIWRHASVDGADHGPSCAAFASLTVELGSHVAGYESWVTGGTSYPWPLHAWADARVDPNPESPNVMSVLQDAQGHHRWHPLGDGYKPQPGDWVLFDGHVEVVTNYAGGVLHTIGGDSLPNYSVNAHSYPGPLSGQGVAGFVDNGLQPAAAAPSGGHGSAPGGHHRPARPAHPAQATARSTATPTAPRAGTPGGAAADANAPADPVGSPVVLAPRAIPAPPTGPELPFLRSRALAGTKAPPNPKAAEQPRAVQARAQDARHVAPKPSQPRSVPRGHAVAAGDAGQPANLVQGRKSGKANIPGTDARPAPAAPKAGPGQAEIPGVLKGQARPPAPPQQTASPRQTGSPRQTASPRPVASARQLAPYQRHNAARSAQPTAPGSAFQRAFIEQVAPGAIATQQKYGVPASVTIAQAIDESAWGQSILATHDHNLFGIKGTGPAGSDLLPTQEFAGGQLVDTTAPFRIYHNMGQSIEAHGKLLARSDYFTNAMANRHQPNAFAAALTGVYATDPGYGTKLIQLMQQYNLYRFDVAARAHRASPAARGGTEIPGVTGHASTAKGRSAWAGSGQPAPGQAAAADARPAPGRHPNPAPGSQPGRKRASGHAGDRAQGAHGAAARQAERPGSADADWATDSAIPGTGYPVPAAGGPSAVAHEHAKRGQAEIPGLPGTAAAPAGHPAQHTRIASRERRAHTPASGRRSGRAQPDRAARADGGHHSGSPPAAAPRPVAPGPAMPRPGTPHGANGTGHPRPGPVHEIAPPGGAQVPGLAGSDLGQALGGPAAAAAAGLGDAEIPGLPLAPTGPTATPHGSSAWPRDSAAPQNGALPQNGAAPQYGAVPQNSALPQYGVAPKDGAWIPGLPGQGSEPARHASQRTGVTGRGPALVGTGHGTNLAPTHARRLVSTGRPSAQHGSHEPGARYTPPPGSSPALAPVPRHRRAAPAAPAVGARPATAPSGSRAIPGMPGGGPAGSSGTTTAPASAMSPSAAPGPAPGSGAEIPGFAPTGPALAPVPSPASGAGTTFGTAEPVPATTTGAPIAAAAAAPIAATTTVITAVRYSHHLPPAVGKAYLTTAKVPLVRGEPLYADVAGQSGIPWQILAACDWMQCKAKSGLSPVYGEKLGTVNPDGTSYRTRSAALERCAYDLLELARTVYHIDLARNEPLSVRELANAFAAFRWGGLLKEHHTSAMEFPYSVAGLTTQHMHMRWPNIDDPQAPDKPGTRFHKPFGAVPLVLSLNYPATA